MVATLAAGALNLRLHVSSAARTLRRGAPYRQRSDDVLEPWSRHRAKVGVDLVTRVASVEEDDVLALSANEREGLYERTAVVEHEVRPRIRRRQP